MGRTADARTSIKMNEDLDAILSKVVGAANAATQSYAVPQDALGQVFSSSNPANPGQGPDIGQAIASANNANYNASTGPGAADGQAVGINTNPVTPQPQPDSALQAILKGFSEPSQPQASSPVDGMLKSLPPNPTPQYHYDRWQSQKRGLETAGIVGLLGMLGHVNPNVLTQLVPGVFTGTVDKQQQLAQDQYARDMTTFNERHQQTQDYIGIAREEALRGYQQQQLNAKRDTGVAASIKGLTTEASKVPFTPDNLQGYTDSVLGHIGGMLRTADNFEPGTARSWLSDHLGPDGLIHSDLSSSQTDLNNAKATYIGGAQTNNTNARTNEVGTKIALNKDELQTRAMARLKQAMDAMGNVNFDDPRVSQSQKEGVIANIEDAAGLKRGALSGMSTMAGLKAQLKKYGLDIQDKRYQEYKLNDSFDRWAKTQQLSINERAQASRASLDAAEEDYRRAQVTWGPSFMQQKQDTPYEVHKKYVADELDLIEKIQDKKTHDDAVLAHSDPTAFIAKYGDGSGPYANNALMGGILRDAILFNRMSAYANAQEFTQPTGAAVKPLPNIPGAGSAAIGARVPGVPVLPGFGPAQPTVTGFSSPPPGVPGYQASTQPRPAPARKKYSFGDILNTMAGKWK